MSNLTTLPLQDGYKTSLSQSWDGNTGTIFVNSTPDFTFPAGNTTYVVVQANGANPKLAEIDSFNDVNKTLNVINVTLLKGASVNNPTGVTYPANTEVIISDNYQFWEDIQTAINSKLDNDGGNTTTTFDLQVSGSAFRIRKDGVDMKFTDDSNAEISLSTIAAAAGADRKVAISATDTTPDELDAKITAGDGINITTVNPGGNEQIDFDVDLAAQGGLEFNAGQLKATDEIINFTEGTFTAGENINTGDALYINSDGNVYKASSATEPQTRFVGFALETVLAAAPLQVQLIKEISGLGGLTVGDKYYLSEANVTDSLLLAEQGFGGPEVYFTGDNRSGQTFQTNQDGYLQDISTYFRKLGTPTGDVGCRIYDSVGGTLLATSATTFDMSAIVNEAKVDFDFTANDLFLTSSTTYFVEFYAVNAGSDATDRLTIDRSNGTVYAGGQAYGYNGSTWSDFSGSDLGFGYTLDNEAVGAGALTNNPIHNVFKVGVATSATKLLIQPQAKDNLI